MVNKKNILTATLIILVLVFIIFSLYGCSGLIGSGKSPKQESVIHKGTQGLEMIFLQNAPPNELIAPPEGERMSFKVGVKMENKGASDIRDGQLLLVVEKNYMNVLGWEIQEGFSQVGAAGDKVAFTLKGRSELDPSGEMIASTADLEALPLERQSVTHTSSVSLTACYGYETIASANVCIDTEVYGMKPVEKTCTPTDITLSDGQGAPVAVDKIEVSMLPAGQEFVKPQFVIHILNKGSGLVFRPDKVRDACSASPLKQDEINVVKIDDVAFSGYSLRGGHIECSPNPLKLRQRNSKVVCSVKEGVISAETETYETILQVTLAYGYSQTISKQVTIERP